MNPVTPDKIANESMLVGAIIRALYPICKLERHNVGSFFTADGRRVKAGAPKGFPDLSGHRRSDGRAVYIECKFGNNTTSPEQEKYLGDCRADGAIAGVCYSVADALALVKSA